MELKELLKCTSGTFLGILLAYLGIIFTTNFSHLLIVTLVFTCILFGCELAIFIFDDSLMRFKEFSKIYLIKNQGISTKATQEENIDENNQESSISQTNKNIND